MKSQNLVRIFRECWDKVCKRYKDKAKNEKDPNTFPPYAWSETDIKYHLACELSRKIPKDVFVHLESTLVPKHFECPLKGKLERFSENPWPNYKKKYKKKPYNPKPDLILSRKSDNQFDVVAEVKFWSYKGKTRKIAKETKSEIGGEIRVLKG